MGHIPGGLTLTLSLAWTGQALRAECDLKEDTAGLRHFDATYKCALPFIFNPSFPLWTRHNLNEPFFGRQAHRYLGYDCHSPHDDIGCCRYDACYFTLDNEDTIRTNLLQIHIKPLDHVRECTDSFITALAKYTGHFINPDPPPTRTLKYPVSNPGVLPHPTDPAVRLWKTAFDHRRTGSMRQNRQPRRHTFPQTAFVTYSLFGIETDQLEHCDQYYVDIYRLLFSQGDKHIDERTATRFLNAHHWSSTDFFETWFQPGAMVVISTPSHPEFFENSNCECLATKLDRQCQPKPCDPAYERSTAHNVREEIGQASVMPSQSRSKARCTDKYDDYNRIAEYPPLR